MTARSVSVQAPELQQPTDGTLIEQSLVEPEVFAALFDRYAADIHHYQHPNHQISPVFPSPSFAYVRQLPTDPQGRVFRLAMQVLWAHVVPPGVQAAIYQALPRIPGVRLHPDAVDAAGRHGVAFARINDGRVREGILLDLRTYQFLGWRRIAVKDFVDKGATVAGRKDPHPHIARGTILEWQARTAAAIVDRPGQRP